MQVARYVPWAGFPIDRVFRGGVRVVTDHRGNLFLEAARGGKVAAPGQVVKAGFGRTVATKNPAAAIDASNGYDQDCAGTIGSGEEWSRRRGAGG